uniref:hypothetical protein n=1 Tax=Escherichia coli TaxID=562 RepID=UPI001D0C8F00
MSRKGNCWDNAVMERFFLNLKMERVWQTRYANHTEAKEPRQPGGCKLKTAPVRPVVAARPAEYVCSEDLFY